MADVISLQSQTQKRCSHEAAVKSLQGLRASGIDALEPIEYGLMQQDGDLCEGVRFAFLHS